MSVLTTLGVFNYGLVLLYGLFLSTFISGGWENTKQRTLVFAACPLFLMIQSVCWLALGADMARQLYPLIVHLPLALILIFILKKRVDVALVSVCTAYLCCQLPRWVDLVVTALTHSELIGEICYTLVIGPLFYLLYRFFVRPAYAAMMASPQSLLLFGSLPVAYYFFDYATVVYSDALYRGYGAIYEFLPTALITFYVMFLTAYHAQSSRRAQAEMQSTMLEAGLKQSQIEVDALRRAEVQTAVYQHDMRHHLNAIDGFLAAGKPQQAEEYIRKVRSDIERITPKRYCDNELVNLLLLRRKGAAHGRSAGGGREAPARAVDLRHRAVRRALQCAGERAARRVRSAGGGPLGDALLRRAAGQAARGDPKPLCRGACHARRPAGLRARGAWLRLPQHPDDRRAARRTVRVPRTGRHLFHAARAARQSGGENPRLTQEAAADAAASFFRPREAKN